jgi:MFS family permease
MENTGNKKISPSVVRLGWVSLLTDTSSEMLYPLIPIFLTTVLKAPMAALGLIEGLAESAASILKIFSGWWSDRTGKRRPFVIGGYSLSALSKPLMVFALTAGWPLVLLLRVMDRTGKGFRSSARDALIADHTPDCLRGRAFGLHRAMDSLGAVLGPLAALFFMSRLGEDAAAYRTVFLWAFVPAILGVFLLFTVRDKPFVSRYAKPQFRWRACNKDFKIFIFINLIFAIGNSSDVFLIVRAKELFAVNPVVMSLLAYMLYNLTYSLGSYPAGMLADRIGPRKVFTLGLLVFGLVYLGFAFNHSPHMLWVLFAVYGFYTALTDGVGKAYASRLVQEELRATGMGVYHMSTGLASFVASTIAGLLWQTLGFRSTFIFGAAAALLAAIMFVFLVKGKR